MGLPYTWSPSEETGCNPAASDTTSAPVCIVTLLVLPDLISILTEIGMAFEDEGWSTGDDIATGGLMTPPELEDDFVKSTSRVAAMGVGIGLLDLISLGAIGIFLVEDPSGLPV